jgi:chorismate dehydratase
LVTDAAPAYCADLLARKEVEAALVPIIEYQRMDGIRVVPDVCVGSHRAVRSVVLVSRHDDLRNVHRVALDESSRTSQALVKIIFREFVHSEPVWESSIPDITAMLQGNDAALVIGDPAMRISPKDFHVFDLATLWRKFTDTGFVFAMWMAREAAAAAVAKVDFAGARDEGLQQIDEIISRYEVDVPLPIDEVREYLTDNITFTVDKSLEQGMRLYFELAYKHGLIDKLRPLQFVES